MSKRETIRSTGSVYFENIVLMGAGYLYWVIMSKLTTTEVIGTSSALISLAAILAVVASFAIPTGLQRFIAKTYLHGKIADTRTYVKISVVIMTVGIIFSALVTVYAYRWILDTPVQDNLLFLTAILIASISITNLVRSIIVSSLAKTAWLPLAAGLSTTCKIAIGVALVLMGLGTFGLMVGFLFAPLVTSVILGCVSLRLLKSESKREVSTRACLTDLVSASFSTWVPLIVNTIGAHLGTIVVYGSFGPNRAAVYFIAFSLVAALLTVMSAAYSVSFPVLSAMADGRKRHIWRAIKITLILSSPLSMGLFWFSNEVLSVFGQAYAEGGLALQILLLSVFPTIISTGISTLMYAYGKYRHVLLIGLAANIPRPLLYIILVPVLENIGAGLSYTLGSFVGFLIALAISHKVGLKMYWKNIFLIVVTPSLIGMFFKLINVNYIFGIACTIVISTLLFWYLKILNATDMKDSLMIFPDRLSQQIVSFLHVFRNKGKNGTSESNIG